jgi:hypothetical protein
MKSTPGLVLKVWDMYQVRVHQSILSAWHNWVRYETPRAVFLADAITFDPRVYDPLRYFAVLHGTRWIGITVNPEGQLVNILTPFSLERHRKMLGTRKWELKQAERRSAMALQPSQ